MKTAVVYTRVSTVGQAEEGYSLDAQRAQIEKYCANNGYDIIASHCDAGKSAKDLQHRPEMCALLDSIQRGVIRPSAVVVWKLTRFTRSLADLSSVCTMLDAHKVALVSISEAFDSSTPSGRMMRNLLGVIAQWEREVISENVSMAMRTRAQLGKRTCSEALGYIPTPNGLRLNTREAKQVRQLFEIYWSTHNLTSTASWCRDHGIVGKRGAKMSAYKVEVILTCPLYAGYYSYNELRTFGGFPTIVSTEEYNHTIDMIASQKHGRGRKRKLVKLESAQKD